MSVTLTIKNVPEQLADKLRARAVASHRSLQGELMAILSNAVAETPAAAAPKAAYRVKGSQKEPPTHGARLTLQQLWERSRQLGNKSPSESAAIIRSLRDERHRR
jgi:plasmid stability protein